MVGGGVRPPRGLTGPALRAAQPRPSTHNAAESDAPGPRASAGRGRAELATSGWLSRRSLRRRPGSRITHRTQVTPMTTLLPCGQRRLHVIPIDGDADRPVTRSPIRLMTGPADPRREGTGGGSARRLSPTSSRHTSDLGAGPARPHICMRTGTPVLVPGKPHGRPTSRTHAPATEAIASEFTARISSVFDLFAPDAPRRTISAVSRRGRHARARGTNARDSSRRSTDSSRRHRAECGPVSSDIIPGGRRGGRHGVFPKPWRGFQRSPDAKLPEEPSRSRLS